MVITNKHHKLIIALLASWVSMFASAQQVVFQPLKSGDYHQLSVGLKNSQIQFEKHQQGRIAFLGGSITYNGGWRDSLMNYFQRRFPNTTFDFVAAGIPSMGTTPSAFRLQRDVLSKGPINLLFVEAAVNDDTNGRTTQEQIRGMEGVIRHLRRTNPTADIVMMHFVDPGKMSDYRNNNEPQVITNHNRVAQHYQIPVINLAKEVTERIDNGEFTWEKDFKDLHPSPYGQGVYAHSMIEFLNTAFKDAVDPKRNITSHPMPNKLDPWCYDRGELIDIVTVSLTEGWEYNSNWEPKDGTGTRNNYTQVPMLISKTPGAVLSTQFKGKAIGIAVAAGQDAGIIEYRIDKGEWQRQNLFTQWSSQLHLPWYYTLASELPAKRHILEMRLREDNDSGSKGRTVRIRYFYVNKP